MKLSDRLHLSTSAVLAILSAFLLIPVSPFGHTAEADPERAYRREIKNDKLKLRITSRTPEQVAAFYEGRGFSKKATDVIKQGCFISVGILNRTGDVLWLELDNWRFIGPSGPLKRYDIPYWKTTWESLDIPLAHQSTFRWTLLPDSRDLQQDEPVGGNLVLERTSKPFTLIANFRTGADKQGKPLSFTFEDLQCRNDQQH